MARFHHLLTVSAAAAALSMVPAPAVAADIAPPVTTTPVIPASIADGWSPEAETAHQWRRHGWDRRWHRHRHRHRNRVDAGDILTGVLVLGGIAAVVNAANENRDRRRDRDRHERDWRDRDVDYRDSRDSDDWRSSGWNRTSGGLENAARLCVTEVEREVRVAQVDGVDRNAYGWEVRGTLEDRAGFTCRIGPDGRIAGIDYSLRRDGQVLSGEERYDNEWESREERSWRD